MGTACPKSEQLFKLIDERLRKMEMIALYKYHHHQPIFAPLIEERNRLALGQEAKRLGLPLPETEVFLVYLVQLCREVQESWIRQFQKKANQKQPLDISLLRQELHALTERIFEHLIKAKEELKNSSLFSTLENSIAQNITLVNQEAKQILLKQLINIAKVKE